MSDGEPIPGVPFNPNKKRLPSVAENWKPKQSPLPTGLTASRPQLFHEPSGAVRDEEGNRITTPEAFDKKVNQISSTTTGFDEQERQKELKIRAELEKLSQS
ncbi:MAG TPA: hypothetical protein VGT05_00530 [Patescibacteria group bacterium]|nr:hypothetical protein [Patescibacteria group bacterium]